MKVAIWNDILDQAGRLRAEGEPFVIATVVAYKSPQSAKPGSKAIIKPDGSMSGWVGGGCVQPIVIREAQKALNTGKPKLVSISPEATHGDWKGVEEYLMTCQGGGSLEIYLEPVLPKPNLLIVGSSPVAQILAGLGRLLEFKVCVADPEASQEQFPEADIVLTDLELLKSRIDSRSFVVVATMGNFDEEGLEAVVGTNPQYFGLVASREKAKSLFQYIRDKGTPAEHIARIKCPAGLELGGETLPEIALSVMAEITQSRRTASEQPREQVKSSKGASLPIMQKAPESYAESIDPVCGMTVATANARYKTVFEESAYYFCCLRCKEAFEQSPQNYLEKTGVGGR
ncbi:MAG TPA: XdhC family protein [Blastocatellia bacterium]|nr:XdhC family protein [Blastocatellia bacterium]